MWKEINQNLQTHFMYTEDMIIDQKKMKKD